MKVAPPPPETTDATDGGATDSDTAATTQAEGGGAAKKPKGRTITRGALEAKRLEFWTTQTEGNQDMWQTLQFASSEKDKKTSAGIMQAAGLTAYSFKERKNHGCCYDTKGFRYEVPSWVLKDPKGVVEGSKADKKKAKAKLTADQLKREAEEITIKARFSNIDVNADINLCVTGGTSFQELRDHCANERGEKQKILVYYMGKRCHLSDSLASAYVQTGYTVQMFVLKKVKQSK
jgi:hypothetical protein